MKTKTKKMKLILEDGTVFEGDSFGFDDYYKSVQAEVVFNTSMTGFTEMLTDPDSHGKLIVCTFPIVGAPGCNSEDIVSEHSPCGVIVREYCREPSNFRCEESMDEFMRKREILGLSGIDTRRLTRILRDRGSMQGIICAADDTETDGTAHFDEHDFYEYYSEDIARMKQRLESGERVFAVGMEHLFLAAAAGCEIYKLRYSHRGSNQPVRDLRTGNVYSTRQNHGWSVRLVPKEAGRVFLENVNDDDIEGIIYGNGSMSVQFEPSVHGGPRSTAYLREEFGEVSEFGESGGKQCR
jgi:carbamoylphosphate synthase small subunit